jgi:serine protease Do
MCTCERPVTVFCKQAPTARRGGFAIPAHTASWVTAVLIRDGKIDRPFLGIAARSEDLSAVHAPSIGRHRAVHVFRVAPNGPADRAGLKDGDWLLAANGNPIANVDDLQRTLVLAPSNDIALLILRGNSQRELVIRSSESSEL